MLTENALLRDQPFIFSAREVGAGRGSGVECVCVCVCVCVRGVGLFFFSQIFFFFFFFLLTKNKNNYFLHGQRANLFSKNGESYSAKVRTDFLQVEDRCPSRMCTDTLHNRD